MISISRIKSAAVVVLVVASLVATSAHAQESVTISVTPTLFDMVAERGQTWQSKLKVVNVNPFDLPVYVEVVNFSPQGEGGDGRFTSISETEQDGTTVAEWFTVPKDVIIVPREQTFEIPFSIRVPETAAPGGHFAAILVGTRPPEGTSGDTKIQTAQMVTSLFFTRVAGEVVEAGTIREFTTEESVYDLPEVTFSLRFENKGNVHLQPQGDIRIENMWGEERGVIPINQHSNFGNVLPESIRKFNFSWKGEWSIADIGRYKAVVTLGYGSDQRQFSTVTTYFWVIPLKLLLSIVFGIIVCISILTWLVRMYVRHMLRLAGVPIENYTSVRLRAVSESKLESRRIPSISEPLRVGILDLRSRLQTTTSIREKLTSGLTFVLRYKLFFLALSFILGLIVVIVWYIIAANTTHRPFEVTYEPLKEAPRVSDSSETVSSEEIIYQQLILDEPHSAQESSNAQSFPIRIINRSGVAGLGAKTRLALERDGYTITSVVADFSSPQSRTVIVANSEFEAEALLLSQTLGNALVSFDTVTDSITIYVGSNTTVR